MTTGVPRKHRADILEFFCRHLVGLCLTYRHKTDEDAGQPDRFAACSGTLIYIHDALLFLTAGHVLKELDELRCCDRVELTGAALADTLGWKRVSDIPIPFDLKNAQLFYIDDEREGLDFGVIVLQPHYARLLEANGMVALAEKNWVHQSTVTFDGYAILGFPEEFTSGRVAVSGGGFVSPTMLFVSRLDTAPVERAATRYHQFIGQLGSQEPRSMKGMSGGPIFGFRIEPNQDCRYWVVALQSSWNRGTRTVYGCSLPVLASLMTQWAKTPGSAS